MFVTVARVTLQIPESGSLKAKRQVLRRITDRVKARFNVSVAEVDDQDLWQKAKIALAVVGGDKRHVGEQMDKILHFIEELYAAPVMEREVETIGFGEDFFGRESPLPLTIPTGDRSLAEVEGLGEWDRRHESSDEPQHKGDLSLEEKRARARALRNPRDWEKK
jgi:uncharacterized protein